MTANLGTAERPILTAQLQLKFDLNVRSLGTRSADAFGSAVRGLADVPDVRVALRQLSWREPISTR